MTLRARIILLVAAPMILLVIGIAVAGQWMMREAMEDIVQNDLHAMAQYSFETIHNPNGPDQFMLNENGDLVNGEFLNLTDPTRIETLKVTADSTDIDMNFYFGDTMIGTTMDERHASAAIGQPVPAHIANTVLGEGKTTYYKDYNIGGEMFYSYFIPVYNDDSETPVGMLSTSEPESKVDDDIANIVRTVVILAAGFAVLILIIASIIVQRIVISPLRRSVDGLGQLAEGKLTVLFSQKDLKDKSMVGDIARSVKHLREQLKVTIQEITDSCQEMHENADALREQAHLSASHIKQISHAVDEISQGATSQADETQSTSDSIVAMGEMITKNNEEIDSLNVNSQNMMVAGDKAIEILEELKEINRHTEEVVTVIRDQTNTTNESATKIREAINFIADIADETNLLSLNASIEAARAGEQGKGFAVVASEISKLADESNEATKRIDDVVTSLINDSNQAVATMTEVQEIMEQQNDKLEETSNMFLELKEGIDVSVEAVGIIADSTRTMDETRSSVEESASSLTEIAQGNAASTQETSASVSELRELVNSMAADSGVLNDIANKLHEQVLFFQLPEEDSDNTTDKPAEAPKENKAEQEAKAPEKAPAPAASAPKTVNDQAKPDDAKKEAPKAEPVKKEVPKAEPVKKDVAKVEPTKTAEDTAEVKDEGAKKEAPAIKRDRLKLADEIKEASRAVSEEGEDKKAEDTSEQKLTDKPEDKDVKEEPEEAKEESKEASEEE